MDNDDIPPLLPPDQQPSIRSDDALYRHWRALMGELGFSERLLWYTFISGTGRPAPILQQVADLPLEPEERLVTNLMWICGKVLASTGHSDGSVAFLLSRPGSARMTSSDRSWARCLSGCARSAGLRVHPVHLANDEALTVFAPDDLISA